MYTNYKKNFYSKTQITRDEQIEIYIGQSAGKQLQNDINNAENEILIVSPYIDETRLDEAINITDKNVNVRLAFSSLRKSQREDILKKLIRQNKETDVAAKERREKLKRRFLIFTISFLCMGIALLTFSFSNIHDKQSFIKKALTIGTSLILFYLSDYFRKKKKEAERIEIYQYDYSETINFKYLANNYEKRNYYENNMFVHSKIYIIDRKIAYLGSLNFTEKGFTSNFETRIRITKKDMVEELVDFVHNNIFNNNSNFKKYDINSLGKSVFPEITY